MSYLVASPDLLVTAAADLSLDPWIDVVEVFRD